MQKYHPVYDFIANFFSVIIALMIFIFIPKVRLLPDFPDHSEIFKILMNYYLALIISIFFLIITSLFISEKLKQLELNKMWLTAMATVAIAWMLTMTMYCSNSPLKVERDSTWLFGVLLFILSFIVFIVSQCNVAAIDQNGEKRNHSIDIVMLTFYLSCIFYILFKNFQ